MSRQVISPVHVAISPDRPYLLLHLSWPIYLDLLMQVLAGTIALMIVGRYSSVAVAAIGNANQILGILYIALGTMSVASSILIALRLGSGDLVRVSQIFTISLLLNTTLSLVASMVALVFSAGIFNLLRIPQEAMADAKLYILFMGSAVVLHGLYVAYMACFRSFSQIKKTLVVSMMMNLLNIVLCSVLIGGFGPVPAFGIVGVAIAAIVSKSVALIALVVLQRTHIPVRLSLKGLRPFPWRILSRMFTIGMPTGLEEFSYAMSQMFVLLFVNTLGTAAVTTRVYCGTIALYCFLFTQAMGQASQVIAGYLIGGGRIEEVDKRTRRTALLAVAISFGTTSLVYLFSYQILSLFTHDPAIIALARQILLIELALEIARAINIIVVRTMQACGDVRYPVVVGLYSMWSIQVGLSYVLGIVLGWGLVGIWVALALDETVRCILYVRRWKKGKWRSLVGNYALEKN
jgi:putative MATE family efflux protein